MCVCVCFSLRISFFFFSFHPQCCPRFSGVGDLLGKGRFLYTNYLHSMLILMFIMYFYVLLCFFFPRISMCRSWGVVWGRGFQGKFFIIFKSLMGFYVLFCHSHTVFFIQMVNRLKCIKLMPFSTDN